MDDSDGRIFAFVLVRERTEPAFPTGFSALAAAKKEHSEKTDASPSLEACINRSRSEFDLSRRRGINGEQVKFEQ